MGGERERNAIRERRFYRGRGEEREEGLLSLPSPPFLLFSLLLFLQKRLIRRLSI